MRKSRLLKGWGILIVILLCVAGITPFAGGAGVDGITVNMTNVPFYRLAQLLVDKDEGKKLEQLDVLSEQVTVVVTTPTPVKEILTNLCKANGMDLTLDNDTYVIKRHVTTPAMATKTPAIDTQAIDLGTALPKGLPGTATPAAPVKNTAATDDNSDSRMVVEAIQLENMSSYEACWMLGVGGSVPPSRDRRRALGSRIQTLVDPRQPVVRAADQGGDYSSPMLGTVTPWPANNGTAGGSTNAYQAFPPPGGIPGGFPPAGGGVLPPAGGVVTPGTLPTTGVNGTTNLNGTQGGQLRNFIPDGIDSIVGIAALNQLLVRAKSREQIQQLADFLKLIDRPTKQVVVELMFVKMSVEDAFQLGSSFKITGAPFFVESKGSSSNGNFNIMFTQGNIQAQIATLLTNRRAKIINAPRVVVQNGGSADIELTDTIPFIISSDSTDIYGRITTTPQIEMQQFSQGMYVNNATILPDNSVILDVQPLIDDPSNSIEIPGTTGTGSVSGSQTTTIQTIVRVKNGESIMMGGFVSENDATAALKVPLLSDLPILGPLLFQSTNNSKTNAETLFFLTPTIIFDDKTNFDGMTTVPPVF